MTLYLYHYYDERTGPFRNLSDLEEHEAERVLDEIRQENKGFASKRSDDYLVIRRGLKEKARELFIGKGGQPVRKYPHYMTFGVGYWIGLKTGSSFPFQLVNSERTRLALPTVICFRR